MKKQTTTKQRTLGSMRRDPLAPEPHQDDYDFPEHERSCFEMEKEYQAYLRSLPEVKLRFDPRLKPVTTSIQLSQRTIDGYTYLAEQHDLPSGQTLMKMVLDSYLMEHLPEDF